MIKSESSGGRTGDGMLWRTKSKLWNTILITIRDGGYVDR